MFGPNVWYGALRPVAGGGIPPQHALVEIKMVFKEGGAYDFHARWEHVRESLSQALEEARASGRTAGNSGADLSAVHLEQLPAYEEVGASVAAPPQRFEQPVPITPPRARQAPPSSNDLVPSSENERSTKPAPGNTSTARQGQTPDEPPPGYEETQQSTLVNHLEESVRNSQ